MKKAVVLALAAIMVLGVAGAAFAESVDYPGSLVAGVWTATNSADPVEVRATVNPKITLTVDTPDASQSVEWLSVDPGVTGLGGKTVTVMVDSNKQFDLHVTESVAAFTAADITLHRTVNDSPNQGKGQDVTFNDAYSIDTTWDTEPGTYTATVTYTVTQD